MGQKVNPNGLRIGINRGWSSQWYAEKGAFAKNIKQDNAIRKFLTTPNKELATKKVAAPASKPAEEVKAEDGAKVAPVAPKGNANIGKLIKDAGLSRIDILRVGSDKLSVVIHVMKPGIVLGQDGANLVFIKNGLEKIVNGRVTKKQLDPKNKKPGDVDIKIVIVEVKNPNLDATLVARDVADQIENRASFRMVQKKAIQRVMRAGAKGIKTSTGGRLNGAEIARTELFFVSSVSRFGLHVLRDSTRPSLARELPEMKEKELVVLSTKTRLATIPVSTDREVRDVLKPLPLLFPVMKRKENSQHVTT